MSAYLYWWGSTSGNGDNESLVQFSGSTVQPNGRLWAFANYSRYIHPGAVRIGASSSNGAVDLSAFKNTDGSLAVVALNTGSGSDTITYSLANTGVANGATVTPYLTNSSNTVAAQGTTTVANGAFTATVPGRSLVTYVIPGGTVSDNTVTVTNLGSQTGTVGTAISGVQVHAADSAAGQALTDSASGLPTGLSISSSGLITGTPTAVGTSNVTVTVTDTTGASGSVTFTWTVNNGTGSGTCQVSYVKNEWGGGFTANLTVTNTSTAAVNGWTVTWSFPGDQKVTNVWNANVTQSGSAVAATNVSYNATIAPGANVQFGFQGTWTSNDISPTAFTLNGTACN